MAIILYLSISPDKLLRLLRGLSDRLLLDGASGHVLVTYYRASETTRLPCICYARQILQRRGKTTISHLSNPPVSVL